MTEATPPRSATVAGPARTAEPPLVEARGVTFGYHREPVVEGVDLAIRRGDFLAILGPNGGGKTTLVRLLLGLLEPWSGQVVHRLSRPGALGYVPQFATFDRTFPLRVRDVVEMGCLARRRPFARLPAAARAAARRAVERMGLGAVAERHVDDLSGGQVQRTLIARALAGEPEILFLDEPLASVDAEFRSSLVEALEELHRDIPVVVVTHDLTPFATAVRQVACVNRCLHYHPEGKLTPHMLEEVYGCPVELITHGVPHRVLAAHGDAAHDPHRRHRHAHHDPSLPAGPEV